MLCKAIVVGTCEHSSGLASYADTLDLGIDLRDGCELIDLDLALESEARSRQGTSLL